MPDGGPPGKSLDKMTRGRCGFMSIASRISKQTQSYHIAQFCFYRCPSGRNDSHIQAHEIPDGWPSEKSKRVNRPTISGCQNTSSEWILLPKPDYATPVTADPSIHLGISTDCSKISADEEHFCFIYQHFHWTRNLRVMWTRLKSIWILTLWLSHQANKI